MMYLQLAIALNAAIALYDDLEGKAIPSNFENKILHVTISDGEGSGSVAVGYWRPRDPQWRPRLVQAEVPSAWRREWQQEKAQDINEIEAVGPLLGLHTWDDLTDGLWLHFRNFSAPGD